MARILVVDDEAFFRQHLTDILTPAGYAVEVASSGEEALQRILRGDVDVMLADMVLPGLSGLDLLKESQRLANPPEVVLVTGHATVETAIQALKAGARDYLVKPFNPDALSHVIHTCLEQRRLLNENQHLKNQIRLFTAGQYLSAIIEMERLLPQAVTAFLQEVGNGRGFAFLLPPERLPRVVGCREIGEEEVGGLVPLLAAAVEDRDGLQHLAPALLGEPGRRLGIVDLFAYPLRNHGTLLGGVVICSPPGAPFTPPPYESNLKYLADQVTLGFLNAMQYEGARDLIFSDDLTGLHNYRYLQTAFDHEIRRSERYRSHFSLLFLDLDLFKEVNDTHGHLVGSQTLCQVAQLLRSCVRDVDLLFRYGGDEFTAILIDTDAKGARIVAERIRERIANHIFSTDTGLTYRLTATIGCSTYPEDGLTKEQLMALADQAMYRGKRQRNVVRSARDLPPA